VFVFNGVTHRFERDLRLPPNRWATITTTLGRVGYVSKGVALVIVGGLVIFGAITSDPEKAGGLDGSLKALTEVPFGVVLLVLIALGLIAYGVFWCVRAFASRLKEQ
jgi:ABC-type Na+ efflux pump permease subunit